jgi:hypothetical protein
MTVVDAEKLFVFLHQFFHFFLAVFKHGNPPLECLEENNEAEPRTAGERHRWNEFGLGIAG